MYQTECTFIYIHISFEQIILYDWKNGKESSTNYKMSMPEKDLKKQQAFECYNLKIDSLLKSRKENNLPYCVNSYQQPPRKKQFFTLNKINSLLSLPLKQILQNKFCLPWKTSFECSFKHTYLYFDVFGYSEKVFFSLAFSVPFLILYIFFH